MNLNSEKLRPKSFGQTIRSSPLRFWVSGRTGPLAPKLPHETPRRHRPATNPGVRGGFAGKLEQPFGLMIVLWNNWWNNLQTTGETNSKQPMKQLVMKSSHKTDYQMVLHYTEWSHETGKKKNSKLSWPFLVQTVYSKNSRGFRGIQFRTFRCFQRNRPKIQSFKISTFWSYLEGRFHRTKHEQTEVGLVPSRPCLLRTDQGGLGVASGPLHLETTNRKHKDLLPNMLDKRRSIYLSICLSVYLSIYLSISIDLS